MMWNMVINAHIQICSVIVQIFYKKHYESSIPIKKFICRVKGLCVCRYFLKAALNFALSFVRIVALGGKMLKIYANMECTF